MIAGVAKAYNLKPAYVLYEMSYANAALYSAVLPSYDDKEEEIDADDPTNAELIRRQLYG
jgi:hypothetical protein